MNNDGSFYEQRRKVYDPDDEESTRVPTMPLLIVLENGVIGEARSVRGAATIVIGNEYLDTEDDTTDWHMRVETARKEAMNAIKSGIDVVVYDSRKGVIEDNYAVKKGHPDYQVDSDPFKLRVDNDRLFLLSLVKIGAIRLLERDDSYFFRQNEKWEHLKNLLCCGTCWHRKEENENLKCSVYDEYKKKLDGKECGSYMFNAGEYREYTRGSYIDIDKEYNVDDLIGYFEGIYPR